MIREQGSTDSPGGLRSFVIGPVYSSVIFQGGGGLDCLLLLCFFKSSSGANSLHICQDKQNLIA